MPNMSAEDLALMKAMETEREELGLCFSYSIALPEKIQFAKYEFWERGHFHEGILYKENNDEEFFTTGNLKISVQGLKNSLYFELWVKVGKEDYYRLGEAYENRTSPDPDTMNGTLANCLPPAMYSNTFEAEVLMADMGKSAPILTIQDPEHPLYVAQHEGITVDRLREIKQINDRDFRNNGFRAWM